MKTTINGIQYEIVVIGDDICLQGTDHDMIFELGWLKAKDDAEDHLRGECPHSNWSRHEVSNLANESLVYWAHAEFRNAVLVNHEDVK